LVSAGSMEKLYEEKSGKVDNLFYITKILPHRVLRKVVNPESITTLIKTLQQIGDPVIARNIIQAHCVIIISSS